jgi:hypothetical protein
VAQGSARVTQPGCVTSVTDALNATSRTSINSGEGGHPRLEDAFWTAERGTNSPMQRSSSHGAQQARRRKR